MSNAVVLLVDDTHEKLKNEGRRNTMISPELRKSIDNYLSQHYLPEENEQTTYIFQDNITKDTKKQQSDDAAVSLSQLMKEVGASFHDTLFAKIDASGMTDVDIYKRANIDRKLFSKIRSNPAYHPRKQTVLALAIALQLSLDDTIDFLSRAGYAFSPSSKGDLIVKYFIERGVYDITAINFALNEYEQQVLE